MRTPAGFDCKYYFADYFRGRDHTECRLLTSPTGSTDWKPDLCKKCVVPGILRANACPNLTLRARVDSPLFGFFKYVKIDAYCTQSREKVKEPHIGCGLCHPLPGVFEEKNP